MTRKELTARDWGAFVVVLAGGVFSLGDSTPWLRALLLPFPFLSWFVAPGRGLGIVSLFAFLLAARGLDGWMRREPAAWGRVFLVFGAVAAFTIAWPVAFLSFHRSGPWSGWWETCREPLRQGLVSLLVIAAATSVGLAWVRRAPVVGAFLLLLVLGGELWWSQGRFVRLVPRPEVHVPEPVRKSNRFGLVADHVDHFRYSPLAAVALELSRRTTVTNEGGVVSKAFGRFLDLVSQEGKAIPAQRFAACDVLYDRRSASWQAVPQPLPRVRFWMARDRDLYHQLFGTERAVPKAWGEAVGEIINIVRESPGELLIGANAFSPGLLLVAETNYPGWTVTVDGLPAPIVEVGGIFRGVMVPAGAHRIHWEFRPEPFRQGLKAFGLGLAVSAVLWYWGGRWRRTRSN